MCMCVFVYVCEMYRYNFRLILPITCESAFGNDAAHSFPPDLKL